MFFVLSGHLVSVSLLSSIRKSQGKKSSFLVFLLKRLFRIIPAYYAFLIVGYLLALLLLSKISPSDIPLPREFPQYFFFYRNYGGPPSRWSMEHLWSLCVEEQFYWIFPAMIAFFTLWISAPERRFLAVAIVLLVAGIGFKAQALVTDFAEWPTYTHNRLDAFGWGILITVLSKTGQEKSWLFNHKGLLLIGGSILILCLTVFAPLPELILRTVSPICWFLVILGVYHTQSRYFAPFRVMAFFSYGIYLWHFLFVIPVQYHFGKGWLGFSLYCLVTLVFAVLSTYGIERPFMRIRDRFIKRLFPKTPESVLQTPEVPVP